MKHTMSTHSCNKRSSTGPRLDFSNQFNPLIRPIDTRIMGTKHNIQILGDNRYSDLKLIMNVINVIVNRIVMSEVPLA